MRRLAVFLCVLVLGFVAGYVCKKLDNSRTHWQAIENYKSYVANPAGWGGRDVPACPDVELSLLVSAGELRHVDLVFPNVPYGRDPAKYWMDYCSTNDGIVFAFGNPSYVGMKPKGAQLLHLNLWFKEASAKDVKQLINEIDSQWGGLVLGERQATTETTP
jgi:hypothetical protein